MDEQYDKREIGFGQSKMEVGKFSAYVKVTCLSLLAFYWLYTFYISLPPLTTARIS